MRILVIGTNTILPNLYCCFNSKLSDFQASRLLALNLFSPCLKFGFLIAIPLYGLTFLAKFGLFPARAAHCLLNTIRVVKFKSNIILIN